MANLATDYGAMVLRTCISHRSFRAGLARGANHQPPTARAHCTLHRTDDRDGGRSAIGTAHCTLLQHQHLAVCRAPFLLTCFLLLASLLLACCFFGPRTAVLGTGVLRSTALLAGSDEDQMTDAIGDERMSGCS
jgi:hypothetical protein